MSLPEMTVSLLSSVSVSQDGYGVPRLGYSGLNLGLQLLWVVVLESPGLYT